MTSCEPLGLGWGADFVFRKWAFAFCLQGERDKWPLPSHLQLPHLSFLQYPSGCCLGKCIKRCDHHSGPGSSHLTLATPGSPQSAGKDLHLWRGAHPLLALKVSLASLSLSISCRSHLRWPRVSITAFIWVPPPRWDEYHFGNCGSVLKLSALKPVNGLYRQQLLLAVYPKSCSSTFFAPHCMNIVSSLYSNLNVKKRWRLAPFQHKGWVNDFHCILHLKVYTWLILCWTGTDTGKIRSHCWEPQQTACTTMESMGFGQCHSFWCTSSTSWNHKQNSGKALFSS